MRHNNMGILQNSKLFLHYQWRGKDVLNLSDVQAMMHPTLSPQSLQLRESSLCLLRAQKRCVHHKTLHTSHLWHAVRRAGNLGATMSVSHLRACCRYPIPLKYAPQGAAYRHRNHGYTRPQTSKMQNQ